MKKPTVPKLRCAVYTRKSSEEGLEQEFNSLDAQREACEAYIASQKPEGWVLVPDQYDDVHGAPDAQYPALVRPVRTRGHRRAHPRQVRCIAQEGDVDGWLCAP